MRRRVRNGCSSSSSVVLWNCTRSSGGNGSINMPPATSIQIGSSVPSSRRKSKADSWKKLRAGQVPPRNRVSDQTAARPSSADAAVRRAMTTPRTATERRSGIARSSAMLHEAALRHEPVQPAREPHGDRPPGRRQRGRRARRRRRDAEIVGRDGQHPPRRQPRRGRRRRRRRESNAARKRDPAGERPPGPHQRRRLLAVVVLRPPRKAAGQARDRGLDPRAQPAADASAPAHVAARNARGGAVLPVVARCDRCCSP